MDEPSLYGHTAVLQAVLDLLERAEQYGPALTAISTSEIATHLQEKSAPLEENYVESTFRELELPNLVKRATPFSLTRIVYDHDSYSSPAGALGECFEANGLAEPKSYFDDLGWSWLSECLQEIEKKRSGQLQTEHLAPQNDEWSPINVDFESDKTRKVMASIEAAKDAIRSDNGYSATYPAERNEVLASLEFSLTHLKDHAIVSYRFIKQNLRVPLQKALERVEENTTGLAIQAALSAIARWFGTNVY